MLKLAYVNPSPPPRQKIAVEIDALVREINSRLALHHDSLVEIAAALHHARGAVTADHAEQFLKSLRYISETLPLDEPSIGAAITSLRALRLKFEERRNGTP